MRGARQRGTPSRYTRFMHRARRPYRIVFICTGNICRSPAAENIFRLRAARAGLRDELEIDSAGTGGWHSGHPVDARSAAALRAAGFSDHGSARELRPRDFSGADLLVCMAREHLEFVAEHGAPAERVLLIRHCDPQHTHEDVPDPYYGGDEGFSQMVLMLDAAMDGLIARVQTDLKQRG